ncbi:ABC transporter substrate-binding protein [Aquabacter sp. CN5-332]|uniref:ABC transporter substrate-binding protein n=1 Tax=Aquabacter sp. CN5-332 TaxID=3156608 RepID=UPI0032B4CF17
MTARKMPAPPSPLSRLAGALAMGALLFSAAPASAADNVKLALNWLVSGKNAPYFVAADKGFYAEQGLNVSISRGNGSGDTIKRVASGESDFGLSDTAAVIGAQANDSSPVKLVGLIFGKSSVAILYVKGAIKEPKDLVGKKLGRSAAGASVNLYPGFLQANKIERAGISEVVVSPSSFLPLMLSKQVDAVLDQSSYLGRYRKGAQEAGMDIDAFRFADYGLDLYGDGIIVKTDLIKSNPDLIKRFMAATLKGSQYAFDHPEEAITIMRKTNPEIDADVGKAELLDTKQLAMTDEVAKHGLGYIDAKHMENVRDIVTKALNLNRSVPVEEIYTLEFLPPQKKS